MAAASAQAVLRATQTGAEATQTGAGVAQTGGAGQIIGVRVAGGIGREVPREWSE